MPVIAVMTLRRAVTLRGAVSLPMAVAVPVAVTSPAVQLVLHVTGRGGVTAAVEHATELGRQHREEHAFQVAPHVTRVGSPRYDDLCVSCEFAAYVNQG